MSLTARLLFLMALGVLPALLVGAYAEYTTRQAQEAEVRSEAVRLASQVGAEMRQIIGGVRSIAAALAQVPAVVAAASEGADWSEECAAVVVRLRREHPGGLRIGVAGADGTLVCADGPVPLDITVQGDHVTRAMETGRFVVGNYGEGPSEEGYLSFAQPLLDEADQPVGAIIVGLNLAWLAEHMRERYAGTDSSISIADRNLVYLLRLPEDEADMVGRAALPEHRPLAARADQGALEVRGPDGIMRVVAITVVAINPAPGDRYDLLVGFGVSRDAAFAPINRGTRNAVLLLALSLLFAMAAAWIGGRYLVRRPVAGLLAAAEHWRKGDYSARVPEKNARAEFGQLAHAFNAMASGIDQRNRQLETSETRFKTLASLVPTFVWFADRHGKLIYANERWYDFTGQRPEDDMPMHWPEALHPEDANRTLATWHEAVANLTPYEAEFRVRRHDGVYHWVLGRAVPMQEVDGQVSGWFGSTTDIDRLKRADEHRSLLVDELNHRVKNTLATVQALAAQSFNTPDPARGRKAFEGRLIALSKAHDVLTRGYWKNAGLREVVGEAISPFETDDERRISLEGPEVELSPRVALALSMALHELLTNAAKYGALSNAEGRVWIIWHIGANGGRRLDLRWQESGGPPAEAPQKKGFGTRLIGTGLAHELGGDVDLRFERTGVVCAFSVPLEVADADGEDSCGSSSEGAGQSVRAERGGAAGGSAA